MWICKNFFFKSFVFKLKHFQIKLDLTNGSCKGFFFHLQCHFFTHHSHPHSIMLKTWWCIHVWLAKKFILTLLDFYHHQQQQEHYHKQHKRDTPNWWEMKWKENQDLTFITIAHGIRVCENFWLLEFHEIVISSYWFGKHNDIWFYAL